MKTFITTILSIAAVASVSAKLTPRQIEAKKELVGCVEMKAYPGSIYVQAKLSGIDYRAMLRRAIAFDGVAIESLFAMRFMGEGGETHCANLLHLLELWGDDRFSKVLAERSEKVRGIVVGSIDYAWADPEWNAFPKTLAVSPSSVTERKEETERDAKGRPVTNSEAKAK